MLVFAATSVEISPVWDFDLSSAFARPGPAVDYSDVARVRAQLQGALDVASVATPVVCTENLNPDVMVMKSAQDGT